MFQSEKQVNNEIEEAESRERKKSRVKMEEDVEQSRIIMNLILFSICVLELMYKIYVCEYECILVNIESLICRTYNYTYNYFKFLYKIKNSVRLIN